MGMFILGMVGCWECAWQALGLRVEPGFGLGVVA